MTTRRGTTNRNQRGSSYSRRRRREWLLATYRADVDLTMGDDGFAIEDDLGEGIACCRCYRCGELLTIETLTVDRIVPACMGGTYKRDNIRPACAFCNSSTGGALAKRAAS